MANLIFERRRRSIFRMPDIPPSQPNNPFHGITLEKMLNDLVQYYGWAYLGQRVPVRCFLFDPSIKSSLKFLRRTPWARAKVENLYWGYLAANNPSSEPQDPS
jgi:uncharacterized protein (DUF2132 family)